MLAEKRFKLILNLLEEKGMVTIQELREILKVSESTIRRDLNALNQNEKLIKVFGGAVSLNSHFGTKDIEVIDRKSLNRERKLQVAEYAASLITPHDFVYLDAGTTTGYMLDFLNTRKAVFVTNEIGHAKRLAAIGIHVILIGGELKSAETIVGSEAVIQLQKYHFTLGFFGTNAVSLNGGFSVSDYREAIIKQTALQQTKRAYVLCDNSKWNQESAVSFGKIDYATIITDNVEKEEYRKLKNVIILKNQEYLFSMKQ